MLRFCFHPSERPKSVFKFEKEKVLKKTWRDLAPRRDALCLKGNPIRRRPKTPVQKRRGEKASPDTTRVATRAFLGRANQYLEGRRLRPDERRRGRRNMSHSPLRPRKRETKRKGAADLSFAPFFSYPTRPSRSSPRYESLAASRKEPNLSRSLILVLILLF